MTRSSLQTMAAPRRATHWGGLSPLLYIEFAGRDGISGWIATIDEFAAPVVQLQIPHGATNIRTRADGLRITRSKRSYWVSRFFSKLSVRSASKLVFTVAQSRYEAIVIPTFHPQGPLWFSLPRRTRHVSRLERRRDNQLHGPGLVVLSPIDWSFRKQRSQQLAAALSHFYDGTVFVGPAALEISSTPPGLAIPTGVQNVSLALLGTVPEVDMASRPFSEREADVTADLLTRHYGVGQHTDVLVQFPAWEPIVRRLMCRRVIYDCIDDHASLPHVRNSIAEEETLLALRSDVCSATSPSLLKHVIELGAAKALLVPNAAPQIASRPRYKRHGVIYVGAIESWFDFPSLYQAARQLPHVTFDIVGKVEVEPPSGCPLNVYFRGELAHEKAVRKMQRARVGILPFVRSKLTQAIDPVKVYEYLASGLGVVSTFPLQDPLTSAPLIKISASPPEFAKLVEQLHDNTTSGDRDRANRWAKDNTWNARAALLMSRLPSSPIARGCSACAVTPDVCSA